MSAWDEYKKTMVATSSLWSAAKSNDVLEIARLIDQGADIDLVDARGYSPLMLAAYTGNQEAFDLLLARGADPDSRDNAGNSVLMGAAFKGHAYMVNKLIAYGANVRLRNHAGLDAVGFATMFGRHEIVALLSRTAPDAVADASVALQVPDSARH